MILKVGIITKCLHSIILFILQMKYLNLVLLALLALSGVYCTLGLDLAGAFTAANFQCIKNAGYSYVIIRGYRSTGALDTAATQSLTNAKSVGLATDMYMFPCRGKSATAQVDEMIAGISGSLYTNVWIDVETNPSAGCSWSGHDANSNCQFLTDIITRVKSKGKGVGIYSSTFMWTSIFGNKSACPSVADSPIWYAHYDKSPSFSDFTSFGGWTKPAIKQFEGDTTVCGLDVDRNYKA